MSTSEPALTGAIPSRAPDVNAQAAGLHAGEGLSPGILSPAELARMANELFNALPNEIQQPAITAARVVLPANSAFSGNPYAAVPSPTPPAVPGLLAGLVELQPGPFVPTPDHGLPPDARSNATVPAAPVGSQAGRAAAPAPPADPAFAFLADARPLFVSPTDAPAAQNTPASAFDSTLPSEEGFASIPSSLFTDIPQSRSAGTPQPPSPAIPGSFDAVDSSAIPTFSFLEDARPLFSDPATLPGPVPADAPSSAASPFATPIDKNAPQLPGTVAHAPGATAPAHDAEQPRPLYTFDGVPAVAPIGGQQELPLDIGLSSYAFDVEAIRRDFPILREVVNGRPLIWLDNGATTQKPQSVIDRLSYFYEHENSNVHRAAHELAARATDAYESAREKTRRFLNASAPREIVFVRGATEAINLVAQSWGRRNIQKDDEIVITWLEHHANIVPWQMLCAEKGARLRVAPVDDSGQVLLDEYEKLLGPKTRLVSITHVSNALGTVVPVKEMVEAAHRHGARVLVDGAQAVSHMRVDVQAINCDFYVFSGHKVFAPTGIGVVYGKSEVLDNMPPWQGGGNIIQDVTFEKTLYQPPPQRFEAGTGNIADAVGLGAAIDYLDRVGIANVSRHEHTLLVYATGALQRIPGLHIIGTAKEKAGVLSFVMDGFRTEEIGDYLNRKGIAVRGGHHCAQPILRRFGLESTLRATLALYNTCEEIDALVAALWDLRQGRHPGLA
ncbi:MAG: family 2A encapsulin nanocompartment cargo protein cysteine desulfurase [Terracidiphilus sp.]|jgi:cysteine desulfurase / selenocysteine lyase